jgi:hypothetical protein
MSRIEPRTFTVSDERASAALDTVETALSKTQLMALEEDCWSFGVPRHQWQALATLRIKYESNAAARLALRRQHEHGANWTPALMSACIQLGLSYETVRKRLGSWVTCERKLPAE